MNRPLFGGLAALAKSALLLIGVPLALLRLWAIVPAPSGVLWRSDSLWVRVVLGFVALLWALAASALVGDLFRALRDGQSVGPSRRWSARWAGAVAALVLLLSTSGHLGVRSETPVTAIHAGVAAPASSSGQSFGLLLPGECLADLAERALGARELWIELAATNAGELQRGGGRFVDPSLLRDSWCFADAPRTTSAGSSPPSSAPRRMLDELALLGLGVVATAALVRRRRTLRLAASSSRPQRAHLRRAEPELEELAAAIEPFGSAPLLDWIEAANRLLRAAFANARIDGEVRLVRAGPDGVTFYFLSPVGDAPPPFRSATGGRSWTLPTTTPLAELPDKQPGRAAPWLVPLGDDGQDAWLLALGPGRRLVIEAERRETDAVLRGIVLALRTLPWADELQVELLGIAPPPGEERCYQLLASSAAALDELASDPPCRRLASSPDSWRREPLVIVGEGGVDPELLDRVNQAAGVIDTEGPGTDRLVHTRNGWRLEPAGVDLAVPAPSAAAAALVARLLDDAAVEPTLLSLAPRQGDEHVPAIDIGLELLGERPRAQLLEPRLATRDASRVAELLGYLVLHGGASTEEALRAALCPGAPERARHRIADLLAAARRALDDLDTARIRLVITHDGDIHLEPLLTSDWTSLLDALEAVRQAAAPEARGLLERLLEHEPRLPTRPPAWMLHEGHVGALSFELCDAWHQLSAFALAEGDWRAAEHAARAGLRVEPTSELLYRDLLVIAGLERGETALAERYLELETALGHAANLEPSDELRRLFEQLSDRRP